jgi:hypothetical protein
LTSPERIEKSTVSELKTKGHNPAPMSADEAMLDEFFSLVAGIAVRLTKEDPSTIIASKPPDWGKAKHESSFIRPGIDRRTA